MWADYPIFGGYNKRQDISFNSEDLLNLFMIGDPKGKKEYAYLSTPGLLEDTVLEGGDDLSRSLFTLNNYMYGVFGGSVYRFTPVIVMGENVLSNQFLGSLGSSSSPVSVTSNNNQQIGIVDGSGVYMVDSTLSNPTVNLITGDGVPPLPLNIAFLDGYFVIPLGNSFSYGISALNDGTQWDVLDRANIQAYPGLNVGVGVVNRRLYFFKTTSTEVWYNAGAADFPFRQDTNLLFNFGCLATNSIVSEFGYLFWLAKDKNGVGSIMMTTGNEPKRVSNDSVDNLIASFTSPSDVASAYIYKDAGHIFYVISWTTDDTTIVYDVNMDVWHRMEMIPSLPSLSDPYADKSRHLSNCHAYFNNTHYIGSYKRPIIYQFSRDFYGNAGQPIHHMRISPHFFDKAYRMIQLENIQLDMQMGIGNATGVTSTVPPTSFSDPLINPKVFLSISRDGGATFGNQHGASMGRIGERRARAIFRRLGQARDIVSKFDIYSEVGPIAILGASINYEVLSK